MCGLTLECLGSGSLAVGSIIAPADIYICPTRHVWTQVDPPLFAEPLFDGS